MNGLAQKFIFGRKGTGLYLERFFTNLSNRDNDTKHFIAISVDFLTVLTALMFSYILRMSSIDLEQIWPAYVFAPIFTVLLFKGLGVNGMVIRHSGIEEMTPLLLGVALSSLVLLVFLFLLSPNPNPRSIFIIYGFLLLVFTIATWHGWKITSAKKSAELKNTLPRIGCSFSDGG